ncbi:MAG: DNA polymerase III subunit gamma/tau [Clostridia bacterium]|nr:DNA polymerase III subunit gamma/tau [Clostridia bacterium]
MHQALYRKWRPQVFDDVYGQEHITSILKYETENHKFSHAYLFCGSRGTGKTTCAKILAKAVNCLSPVNGSPCNECEACRAIDSGAATDVLEMDAASNNGVENIRDIRDEVVYTPTMLKYRVYIVDEVHMLSGSAFNALLKTLEEPPSHVVFVLATTELHKLPATIISRCQRFDFRRIATDVLVSRLSYIAEQENIEADREALRAIAKLAQGGMRDAISLLELCAGNRTRITEELVDSTVGSGGKEKIRATVEAISTADYDTLFGVVDEVVRSSKDIAVFWQELISYYRDMLVFKTTKSADKYLDLTDNEREMLARTAELFTKETLLAHCRMLDDSLYTMQKAGAVKRIVAEMTLIKMSDRTLDTGSDNILSRLSKLEMAVASGAVATVKNTTSVKQTEKKSAEAAPKAEENKSAHDVNSEKKAEKPASEAKTQKLIRGWSEIAGRVAGDGYLLSFLKLAKGYTTADGKVCVKFSNDFAMEMIEKAGIKATLCSVINVELQTSYSENDIRYEVSAELGSDEPDDLDSFDV